MASASHSTPLCFGQLSRKEANLLVERFEHPLGAARRPFGHDCWGLAVDGEAIAVAMGLSTVSARVHKDLVRGNVVELGRLARHSDHPRVLRVMLRCWTDFLAQRWPYWEVEAAVSYALNGLRGKPRVKAGDLYRFDGWTKIPGVRRSGGGGTWSRAPKANEIGDGTKTLFIYRYDGAP
jgi:hypothetical protein